MTNKNCITRLASVLGLLLLGTVTAQAVPMTYNVQLFDSGILGGSGFFTVDTLGQTTGQCDSYTALPTGCLLDFGFDIVGDGSFTKANSEGAIQFLALDGIITDYVFSALSPTRNQPTALLVVVDAPSENLRTWWVDTSEGDSFGCLTPSTCNVATTVPEPTTLSLLGLTLAGLGYSRKRKAT